MKYYIFFVICIGCKYANAQSKIESHTYIQKSTVYHIQNETEIESLGNDIQHLKNRLTTAELKIQNQENQISTLHQILISHNSQSNSDRININDSIDSFPISSDSVWANLDIKASFPGGEDKFMEFVTNAFQYPIRCQDDNINGFVILKFMVDEIGRISRISAIEETPNCPEFTTEAIRVLKKSPQWLPGQINGISVKSWNEITIKLNVSDRNKRKKIR